MACNIILGNRGSGKTTSQYRKIFQILSETEKKVYLILPEQATFFHEKYIEEMRDGQSLWNLEITSLRRLSQKYVYRNVLSPLGQHLAFYEMLRERKNDFQSFRMKEISSGFVEALLRVVKEAMMNHLTAEDMRTKGTSLGTCEIAGDLGDKLEDIASLLEAIETSESEVLFSENQLLNDFGKIIGEQRLFSDAVFFFDDFFDFTAVEYGIINALFSVGAELSFAFLYKEDHTFFEKVRHAVDRIAFLGENNHVDVTKEFLPERVVEGALGHLEQYYRNDGLVKKYEEDTDAIAMFHCNNRETEVVEMAQRICALKEEGLSEKEIGICFHDIGSYLPYIKSIFSQYHIAYYIDEETELQNSPMFSFISAFLRLIAEKSSFASMFALLKSGLFPIDSNDIDIYENYCLAHGIKGKMFYQEKPWSYVNDGEDLERVMTVRERIKEFLLPFIERMTEADTPKEYAVVLWDFLIESKAFLKVEAWIKTEKEWGRFLKAQELEGSIGGLANLLDQMVLVFGDKTMTVDTFFEVFSMGSRVQKVRTIPMGTNEVEISVLGKSRPAAKAVIFLGGVNEGEFPDYSSREGFLNKNDRELLGTEENFWTRNKTFFYENENILIYQGLTLSTHRLIISYCSGVSQDVDGARHLPSIIIYVIKEMFPHLEDKEMREGDFPMLAASFWSPHEVIGALPCYYGLQEEDGVWEKAAEILQENPVTQNAVSLALASMSYQGMAAPLSPNIMEKYLGENLFLNVSSLEVYRRCPFSYFAKYGLRLKERKVLMFSAPDLGTFYHEALRELVERMHDRGIPWTKLKEQGTMILDEIIDEMREHFGEEALFSQEQGDFICSVIKENLLLSISLMVSRIERGDKFYPLHWEASFGPGEALQSQSFTLKDGNKKLTLTGQIDRIDIAEGEEKTYFRVVDYKSSDKDLNMDEIYYGLKLQLLIYMMVIENNVKKEGTSNFAPGGFFYFSLKDIVIKDDGDLTDEKLEKELEKAGQMKGFCVGSNNVAAFYPEDERMERLSETDYRVLMKYLHCMIEEIGTDIFRGINTISPYCRERFYSCTYCPYHAICGYEEELQGKERNLYNLKKETAFAKISEKVQEGGDV